MTIKHDAITGEVMFRSYSLQECDRFETAQSRAMEMPIPEDLLSELKGRTGKFIITGGRHLRYNSADQEALIEIFKPVFERLSTLQATVTRLSAPVSDEEWGKHSNMAQTQGDTFGFVTRWAVNRLLARRASHRQEGQNENTRLKAQLERVRIAAVEGLKTECCHMEIAGDERYCSRCGWEARVLASPLVSIYELQNQKLKEALKQVGAVASGESQIAMDDTQGMEYLSDYVSSVWAEIEDLDSLATRTPQADKEEKK